LVTQVGVLLQRAYHAVLTLPTQSEVCICCPLHCPKSKFCLRLPKP